MTIEQIKANIQKEKEILNYLLAIDKIKISDEEREFYNSLEVSLKNHLSMLNSSLAELIKAIPEPEEKREKAEEREERIQRRIITVQGNLSIDRKKREEYLKNIQIEEEMLKSLKRKISAMRPVETKIESYKQINPYTKFANQIFSNISLSLAKLEMFKPLSLSLKKAGMPYLLSTYISMMLLGCLISFLITLILVPIIIISEVIPTTFAVLSIIIVPIAVFIIFYAYPSGEASSNRSKINDELPFAVMHMSAIAGSGIEPSKVFEILASSKEYPALRKEMTKIVNQINFYGYNLVAALRATAKTTSSERFADVLNGIATTISSGGDLKEYLAKIASDTLLDYKLRRKRFTTISETYADIYTGLLVAAPLMFMLILVLMNVIGGGFGGLSTSSLAMIGIGVLIVVNIGFLIFLQVSQPEA